MFVAQFHFVQIQQLSLSHFRNYASLSLAFGNGINCLTGNNGEGKTNILEAIHFLAMTRGFQPQNEKFALKENESYFMIQSRILREKETVLLDCNYVPGKGKKILVNKQPIEKMSAHLGFLPLVAILPSDTDLIEGGGAVRRRFMDSFISQYDHAYLAQLIRYERALQQRNALLQRMKEEARFNAAEIEPWTNEIIQAGIFIHGIRSTFLESFLPFFRERFSKIVSEKELPEIVYESEFRDNNVAEWKARFEEKKESERVLGRTRTGTHREDLSLSIGGQPVKNFGSQGQRKTFVIALKLAEYSMLMQRTGHAPVLLLDDIFDKLDVHRLKAITHILETETPGQVFVTDTHLERCREIFGVIQEREVRYFTVNAGKVLQSEIHV